MPEMIIYVDRHVQLISCENNLIYIYIYIYIYIFVCVCVCVCVCGGSRNKITKHWLKYQRKEPKASIISQRQNHILRL
jgi:hypothetical protein